MPEWVSIVSVTADTIEQAGTVLAERLNHDEDYGFTYTVGFDSPRPAEPGITFTRDQVEAWVGHVLTDDEVTDLEDAAPNSSIPEAFEAIAHEGIGIVHRTGEDARS